MRPRELLVPGAVSDSAEQSLARQRYPQLPSEEAIVHFRADRERAGLGALDERLRQSRGTVRNCKWMHPASGRIVYELHLERPAYYEPDPTTERMSLFGEASTKTLSLREIPGRSAHRSLPVNRGDLRDVAGRTHVANMLRTLRQELRESTAEENA
jgi:hypothetical protein